MSVLHGRPPNREPTGVSPILGWPNRCKEFRIPRGHVLARVEEQQILQGERHSLGTREEKMSSQVVLPRGAHVFFFAATRPKGPLPTEPARDRGTKIDSVFGIQHCNDRKQCQEPNRGKALRLSASFTSSTRECLPGHLRIRSYAVRDNRLVHKKRAAQVHHIGGQVSPPPKPAKQARQDPLLT